MVDHLCDGVSMDAAISENCLKDGVCDKMKAPREKLPSPNNKALHPDKIFCAPMSRDLGEMLSAPHDRFDIVQ